MVLSIVDWLGSIFMRDLRGELQLLMTTNENTATQKSSNQLSIPKYKQPDLLRKPLVFPL